MRTILPSLHSASLFRPPSTLRGDSPPRTPHIGNALGSNPCREENERFVGMLGEETYYLAQKRISGRILRVFRSYPGPWFVYGFENDGAKTVGEPLLLSTGERELVAPRHEI